MTNLRINLSRAYDEKGAWNGTRVVFHGIDLPPFVSSALESDVVREAGDKLRAAGVPKGTPVRVSYWSVELEG